MEQDDFRDILKRYRQGEASPEERKLIDAWYAAMGKDASQDIPGEPESHDLGWANIHTHVKRSRNIGNQRRLLQWFATGIAASLIIAVVSFLFLGDRRTTNSVITRANEPSQSWKDVVNKTASTKTVVLPDSSQVSLEPQSTLRYLFDASERKVYLKGEAFFEVRHNPNVPFFVYANEVTTKVLGTSFTVKANENEPSVTVVVKTGRVSVYANRVEEEESSGSEAIILTPNQQIVFDRKEKEVAKTIVKNPQVIIPKEEIRLMRFEEAPVVKIFKALEKAYGVKLEFDEAIFSGCELTTVISDDGIYNRLDIICDAIGTTYSVQEDRIVISGAGCSGNEKE
jgi:ferric-dicitrate binding protein FerR (iron transport regulator)